jgi:hypothetical protein
MWACELEMLLVLWKNLATALSTLPNPILSIVACATVASCLGLGDGWREEEASKATRRKLLAKFKRKRLETGPCDELFLRIAITSPSPLTPLWQRCRLSTSANLGILLLPDLGASSYGSRHFSPSLSFLFSLNLTSDMALMLSNIEHQARLICSPSSLGQHCSYCNGQTRWMFSCCRAYSQAGRFSCLLSSPSSRSSEPGPLFPLSLFLLLIDIHCPGWLCTC